MTDGELSSALERLNEASVARANRRAFETRLETIDLAYEAISLHLGYDKETMSELEADPNPTGETIGLYVTEDLVVAPEKADKPTRVFGLLLISPEAGSYDTKDDENVFPRLKIFVPVPDDCFIEDFEMPPANTVNEIYLEYSLNGNEFPMRYSINRAWMEEYVAAADPEGSGSELDYDKFLQKTEEKVGESVITVVEAFRDIVNMRAVPQRYVTVGRPGVNDV